MNRLICLNKRGVQLTGIAVPGALLMVKIPNLVSLAYREFFLCVYVVSEIAIVRAWSPLGFIYWSGYLAFCWE